MDSYLTAIKWGGDGAWGLLESFHMRKGRSSASIPCPLRESDVSLHPSATKEVCIKCSLYSQCLTETFPQLAPSLILGHRYLVCTGATCWGCSPSLPLSFASQSVMFATPAIFRNSILSCASIFYSTEQQERQDMGPAKHLSGLGTGWEAHSCSLSILSVPVCPPKHGLSHSSMMQSPHTNTTLLPTDSRHLPHLSWTDSSIISFPRGF